MGKGTIKVKRKCCHSKPPCKSCPIVVLREALRESKAEEVRQNQQKPPKKSAAELQETREAEGSDQAAVTPNTVDEGSTAEEAPARNSAPPTLLEQAEAIVAQRYAEPRTTGGTGPLPEKTPRDDAKRGSNKAPKKAAGKRKKKDKKAGKKKDAA